jgi:hypothetical protein
MEYSRLVRRNSERHDGWTVSKAATLRIRRAAVERSCKGTLYFGEDGAI